MEYQKCKCISCSISYTAGGLQKLYAMGADGDGKCSACHGTGFVILEIE